MLKTSFFDSGKVDIECPRCKLSCSIDFKKRNNGRVFVGDLIKICPNCGYLLNRRKKDAEVEKDGSGEVA
jgi:hypothetical protein